MMKFTAQQIATLVQGSIEGDSQRSVHAFAKIEDGKEGDLCFLANPRYEHFIYSTRAGIVLVSESLTLKQPVTSTLIRVKDAYAAFATLLQTYQDLTTVRPQPGKEMHSHVAASASIDESAYIGSFVYVSEGAQVGKQSYIHPNCYVGANVKIGDRVILYPGVTIYHNCIIGNDCIIHSGTVIGSDGFGFAPENGHFRKIPQLGNVVIEDMVEIGANCSIDRATMGSTRIRKGAKLDNLIQIAHNVEVGENTVIASQAGISGSTKIGSYCKVGGQAGIVGHISIADGTQINAQSGVSKEIELPNTSLTGSPAFDYVPALRSQVVYRQLPELQKRLIELEKKISEFENKTR